MAERVRLMASAAVIPADSKRKVQSTVDAYSAWLIHALIGIKGTTDADVLATIVHEWIRDNQDFLKESGLEAPKIKTDRLVLLSTPTEQDA